MDNFVGLSGVTWHLDAIVFPLGLEAGLLLSQVTW